MVQHDVSSVVDSGGEILHGAFSKLVDSEDNVIDVRDSVDVILKDIYAEWMKQVWNQRERPRNQNM